MPLLCLAQSRKTNAEKVCHFIRHQHHPEERDGKVREGGDGVSLAAHEAAPTRRQDRDCGGRAPVILSTERTGRVRRSEKRMPRCLVQRRRMRTLPKGKVEVV